MLCDEESDEEGGRREEDPQQVIVDTLIQFLRAWVPLVLKVRRVYPSFVFVSPLVYPAAPIQQGSFRAPTVSASVTPKPSHPAVQNKEVAEYLEEVLAQARQLLAHQSPPPSQVAVLVIPCEPQDAPPSLLASSPGVPPIERHILSFGGLLASRSSFSSSGAIRHRLVSALSKLWRAYNTHDLVCALPASMALTWNLALAVPGRAVPSHPRWEISSVPPIPHQTRKVTPIRTFFVFPE
ncbi:MAG: hypothetical protein Q8P67_28435, partial [archaeon]|nr:hypothetical protein [archaeon]